METSRIERAMDGAVAPPVDVPERREGKRHTSVLLIGRADFGGREHACLVHNISERGLMARFLSPPTVGAKVVMQLRGLDPAEATVRWSRGACAGMEFTLPQAIEPVLHPRSAAGPRVRTPRFDICLPAALEVDGESHEVRMIDVSVGGAKLADAPPVRIGSHARLRVADSPLIFAGSPCWQHEDRTGFQFVTALTLQRLADVLDTDQAAH